MASPKSSIDNSKDNAGFTFESNGITYVLPNIVDVAWANVFRNQVVFEDNKDGTLSPKEIKKTRRHSKPFCSAQTAVTANSLSKQVIVLDGPANHECGAQFSRHKLASDSLRAKHPPERSPHRYTTSPGGK